MKVRRALRGLLLLLQTIVVAVLLLENPPSCSAFVSFASLRWYDAFKPRPHRFANSAPLKEASSLRGPQPSNRRAWNPRQEQSFRAIRNRLSIIRHRARQDQHDLNDQRQAQVFHTQSQQKQNRRVISGHHKEKSPKWRDLSLEDSDDSDSPHQHVFVEYDEEELVEEPVEHVKPVEHVEHVHYEHGLEHSPEEEILPDPPQRKRPLPFAVNDQIKIRHDGRKSKNKYNRKEAQNKHLTYDAIYYPTARPRLLSTPKPYNRNHVKTSSKKYEVETNLTFNTLFYPFYPTPRPKATTPRTYRPPITGPKHTSTSNSYQSPPKPRPSTSNSYHSTPKPRPKQTPTPKTYYPTINPENPLTYNQHYTTSKPKYTPSSNHHYSTSKPKHTLSSSNPHYPPSKPSQSQFSYSSGQSSSVVDPEGCVETDGTYRSGGEIWELPGCGRAGCGMSINGLGWELWQEQCRGEIQNPEYKCVIEADESLAFPECCPRPVQCRNET